MDSRPHIFPQFASGPSFQQANASGMLDFENMNIEEQQAVLALVYI